jgi:hypothetical protein
LLNELKDLGLVESRDSFGGLEEKVFLVTSLGQALANASAAKPIHRRTADRVLDRLLERLRIVDSTEEFAYRVGNMVLFGSILSGAERLGDVDVAIDLQPKTRDETAFEAWCQWRRRTAEERGRMLRSIFEYDSWPQREIVQSLKIGSRSLRLHDFQELKQLPAVSYRVLRGDTKQIAALIPNGRSV